MTNDSGTLVGRGRLAGAKVALLIGPVLSLIIGAVAGAITIWIEPNHSVRDVLGGAAAVGTIFGFCGLGASLVLATAWLSSPARVRYYVRGTSIVVRRGRRELVAVDAALCQQIDGAGWATSRSLVVDIGNFSSMMGDLPCVACTRKRADGSEQIQLLPRVLIVGLRDLDEFWHRMVTELERGGVPTSRLVTSPWPPASRSS